MRATDLKPSGIEILLTLDSEVKCLNSKGLESGDFSEKTAAYCKELSIKGFWLPFCTAKMLRKTESNN